MTYATDRADAIRQATDHVRARQERTIGAMDAAMVAMLDAGATLDQLEIATVQGSPDVWRVRFRQCPTCRPEPA